MDVQSSESLDSFFAVADPWGYDQNSDDKRRVAHLISALPNRDFGRVLDIGCGAGFLTTRLPGRKVTGIDLSSTAIAWAQDRAVRLGRTNTTFEVGNVLKLQELEAHQFDLVVITGVLYRQYIGEAFTTVSNSIIRLMVPGGHLVHAHIDQWFRYGFPLKKLVSRTYPYRDYIHRLEVYET